MSNSINKVILVGNVGEEMRFHEFNDENCIFRFSLATSDYYKDKTTGAKKSITEWHTVVCKNRLAEFCNKYLTKGDKVFVEGKIKTRKWGDPDQIKYTTEIITEQIQILSSKKSKSEKNSISESFDEDDNDLSF
ncbi:MAG: single-stranded DNA-binding protein [Flavobacteriales bacterium]|nr:single-stranded DNA-binding protein [Flavobacteriales bacterium]